jgi:hypothetical protein
MLFSTAGVDIAEVRADTQEYAYAEELVEFAHHLPLTVSLLGKLVQANGGEITTDLVGTVKGDTLRKHGTLPESFAAMPTRIIGASVGSIKGRDRKLAVACFFVFAAFPEDSIVPITRWGPSSRGRRRCPRLNQGRFTEAQ